MADRGVSSIPPGDISRFGGFLGRRFDANREARLKDWVLAEEFIRQHERQDYGDWFWMGEQVGKWLDAATYAGLVSRDKDLLKNVQDILERLARTQEEDGYLGITKRRYRIPVRGMQLYEWYYVLHGLMVCADLLQSDLALQTARRLGEYIIKTWGPEPGQFPLAGRFPGNGHGGGEGTLILEPIVLLGDRTGDRRFVDWGERVLAKWDEWLAAYPESRFTCGYTGMRQFAAGEKDVYELAALFNATGKSEYRDVVLGSIDRLADEWIFLTGGMSSGERYLPREFYHPNGDIEVCPQHTWILLLEQALQWTGEAKYAAEIERDLLNHFFAAQLADGSNWSYMTPLNGKAQEPEGPNCCNASGHRIAARMPTYFYGLRDGAPAVFLYGDGEAIVRTPDQPPLTLQQKTAFPSDGEVMITVQPQDAAHFALHLRIPPYAVGATAQVDGEPFTAPAGEFLVLEREWKPGDVVRLSLPMPLSCQAGERMLALQRGPLVYAYFQDAQPDPVVFHGHHGRYPEDIELQVDVENPASNVVEEPAAEGLLGPALRVPARLRPYAPIFSRAEGNARLPSAEDLSVVLLPFVNQGAIRGQFRVFMEQAR